MFATCDSCGDEGEVKKHNHHYVCGTCGPTTLDIEVSLIMNCLEYIYSSVLQKEERLKGKRRLRRAQPGPECTKESVKRKQRECTEESVKRKQRECTEDNRRAENDRIKHNVKAKDFAVAGEDGGGACNMPATKPVGHPVAEEREQMIDAEDTKRSDIEKAKQRLLQSIGRRYADCRPPKGYTQRVWYPCCHCEQPLYSSFCKPCAHEICPDCRAREFPVLEVEEEEEVKEEEEEEVGRRWWR
jgi:hypothetical protein